MNFNDHSKLAGLHAFLSASKYHWLNDDLEGLEKRYFNYQAVERGTRLHAIAEELINMRIRLPKNNNTLNLYVNDAISFKMKTEQVLYYSPNCFGTADTISFKKNFLRIHDYKSGGSRASMKQLEVYAALFCLEYQVNPNTIEIELRIYQLDEVMVHHPEKEEILYIMNKIVEFDKYIEVLKQEVI